MSRLPWPEPIATASGPTAAAILRQLWSESERVEAAVADANRLQELLDPDDLVATPHTVRIIAAAATVKQAPDAWRLTVVDQLPAPDLLLFYRGGSSFPDSALVFTAGIGSRSWVTYYRRPIVLHHLRERFNKLAAVESVRPTLAAGSIREQPARPVSLSPNQIAAELPGPEYVSPAELYRRVLSAHFAGHERSTDDSTNAGLTLAAHQARAFERARDIMARYGGVIVADAVGLGKTYIGLRLVQRTLDEGGRVVLVVPAALREQWERELAYVGIGAPPNRPAAATTSDNLDLWVREDAAVRVLSMESLGRRNFDAARLSGADLVLIDEAHNFRNPLTRRYRALSDLVRHSRVALLTATPINNTLLDLQHLIDLFAAPGAFRHLGITDYRERFRRAADGDGDVRSIISACVLRRTRQFLRRYYGRISVRDPLNGGEVDLRFPERRPPLAVEYDLAGTYGELFAGLEQWLEALAFSAIDPGSNADDSADPLASPGELLKIILLKRLESSVEAFRSTVVQQLAWCNTALRAIDAGRVLTRPDYRASFRGPADDPGSQLAFFELMLPAPSIEPDRVTEFRAGLENDTAILSRIHSAIVAIGPEGDRKLQRLIELLDGPLADEKVLIFTEFKDTARYIYHRLRHRPFVAQIDSESARLGLDRANRSEVIERFAPRSNGLRPPPARERVDTLIATDVLSEGLNLQDASTVVSYDLPWNPVRLMQRIGRIDRLGAVHDVVQLHHFLPAHHLDRLLGLMGRLNTKVATIERTLGLDQQVLAAPGDGDRAMQHIRVLAREPDGYERIEEDIEGPLDPEERAYIDFVQLSTTAASDEQLPVAVSSVTDPAATVPRAFAYWRIERDGGSRGLWMCCDLENGCVIEDRAALVVAFRGAIDMRPRKKSKQAIDAARRGFARYARSMAARLEVSRIAGDALSPNLPQCRISTRLSRAYDSGSFRLNPDLRSKFDRLLDRLSRRFTIAGERALSRLANNLPDDLDATWLATLERQVREMEAESSDSDRLLEIGTLLILPTGTGT